MLKGTLKKLSGSSKKKKKSQDELVIDDDAKMMEEEVLDENSIEDSFDNFDAFEDKPEDTGKVTELENRIKDLENEVGLMSSQLNTIKGVNEEIGKRIEEIEENIRKLLGIYEMVTEGINPFATEIDEAHEGFGIFSSLNKNEKEEIPNEVMTREAESFFEEFEEDIPNDTLEDYSNVDAIEDGVENAKDPGNSPEEVFKRLKAEATDSNDNFTVDMSGNQETDFDSNNMNCFAIDDKKVLEPPKQPRTAQKKIYLERIERDYLSEVVILKWVDFLIATFGRKKMEEVLNFYADIDWISRDVRDFLINFSKGCPINNEELDRIHEPTIVDHLKSLVFIAKLSNADVGISDLEQVIRDVDLLVEHINEMMTTHGIFNVNS